MIFVHLFVRLLIQIPSLSESSPLSQILKYGPPLTPLVRLEGSDH